MPEIGLTKFNAGVAEDTSKDGDSSPFTAAVGTTYIISMGTGTPAADLDITFPSTSLSAGDAFTVMLDSADATYGVDFIGTIATVSYSSGGSFRLLLAGDHITFRYKSATIGWLAY